MEASTSKQKEVWYVDSETSNHTMNHEEWFLSLEKTEQPGCIETDDDTINPIEHIGNVPRHGVAQRKIHAATERRGPKKEPYNN